ncbi:MULTISPECIES: hypothetical protein [Xanthobacter]
MRWTDPTVTAVLRAAVNEAIKTVGINALRRTSMFASSSRPAKLDKAA